MQTTYEFNKGVWVFKVKVISWWLNTPGSGFRWAFIGPLVSSLKPKAHKVSLWPWSGVHNFKDLLWNRLADQVEILCGASLDSGIEILLGVSWSHDQVGRHTYIMVKTLQKSSSEPVRRFVASGTPAHQSLQNDGPGMTLTYFTARSILET